MGLRNPNEQTNKNTSNMRIHSLQNNIHVSKVHCGSAFKSGASGLRYYCNSICVRSCCNWRASLWIPNQKKSKNKQSLDRDHTWRNLNLHFFPRNTPLHMITHKEHTQHPSWKEKKINTLGSLPSPSVYPLLCVPLFSPQPIIHPDLPEH